MREDTSLMGTREVFEYLAKQQAKRWPGSYSIHDRPRHAVDPTSVPRDADGAYRIHRRLDGRSVSWRPAA